MNIIYQGSEQYRNFYNLIIGDRYYSSIEKIIQIMAEKSGAEIRFFPETSMYGIVFENEQDYIIFKLKYG